MKLKGQSTVELFNAKTGELTEKQTNKNFITNAYKGYAETYVKNYFGMLGGLPNRTPESMAGGIQLFSALMNASLDDIYPNATNGAACIGHAATTYSGAEPKRGTLNAAESAAVMDGPTQIGYKWVWDFATDRANGTINSMAMTSATGGDLGYANTSFIPAEVVAQSPFGGGAMRTNQSGNIPVGARLVYVAEDYSYAIFQQYGLQRAEMLFRYSRNNFSSIAYKDYPRMFWEDQTLTLPANTYITFHQFGTTLYGMQYDTVTKEAVLGIYNPSTMSLTSVVCTLNSSGVDTFYTTSWAYLAQDVWGGQGMCTFGIIGDDIYIVCTNTNLHLAKFNMTTGAKIADYVAPASVNNANLYFYGASNFSTKLICFTGNDRYATPQSSTTPHTFFDGENWNTGFSVLSGIQYSYPTYGYYSLYGTALCVSIIVNTGLRNYVHPLAFFTKNNLAAPVVKTPSNTMKVTYQLTWG